MKHELVEWLCINFAIEWLCVQTLMRTKINFLFSKFYFDLNMKG